MYRMLCQDNIVKCVLEFSETKDWVTIIKSYESNIAVEEYKEEDGVDSKQILLDI